MYHYRVNVPTSGEIATAKETIVDRLEYFNDREHYLLYDTGNVTEKRFILVSDKRVTKNTLKELSDIFETSVTTEAINIKNVDRRTLKQIKTAKSLMINNDYSGDQKTLLVTDNVIQLFEKVDSITVFAKYREFYKNFAGYIDRTAGMKAKCLYNVVLINESGISLDSHIELLYGLFAAKGLLTEYVMVTGDKYDASRTEKDTGFVYYVDDNDWVIDDGGEHLRASDEVKLFNKIRRSNNIYITSMTQEEYTKLSVLDCFAAAFPNITVIEELSADEKTAFICDIANEYGFSVNKDGFAGNGFINNAPLDKIETALRQAVLRKVTAKDNTFCLAVSDIDSKIKKTKKVSAFVELESLIGLDGVKKTVREITTFLKKRGKNAMPCLHMAFLGNPGVGKTSVARIIARIFAETGVIKKNLLIETDREGLVGAYVGHTAIKTKNKIEEAMGGILFIDEAYSLNAGDNIDYGNEAMATLVKAMEDKRDELIVILAGYTKEMNSMLDVNPGLRDRIGFYIDFPDYNESELLQIFEKFCKDNKYKLSKSAIDTLTNGFSRIVKAKSQNFSNARLVRKLFERIRMKQSLRTSNNIITDIDVQAAFAESDIAVLMGSNSRVKMGFSE